MMLDLTWQQLFRRALYIINAAGLGEEDWTFGGGTVLAIQYGHRVSKDIDIFLTDAQLLPLLTPRLNGMVWDQTDDYTEGSHFVKLRFAEGEVDFIIAPRLTAPCCTVENICGQIVRVEKPREIMAKKFLYRAESFHVRDVIDAAVVYAHSSEEMMGAAETFRSKIETIERRWRKLQPFFRTEAQRLQLLQGTLLDEAPRLFDQFLTASGNMLGHHPHHSNPRTVKRDS